MSADELNFMRNEKIRAAEKLRAERDRTPRWRWFKRLRLELRYLKLADEVRDMAVAIFKARR